jgi:hypothetical protein
LQLLRLRRLPCLCRGQHLPQLRLGASHLLLRSGKLAARVLKCRPQLLYLPLCRCPLLGKALSARGELFLKSFSQLCECGVFFRQLALSQLTSSSQLGNLREMEVIFSKE